MNTPTPRQPLTSSKTLVDARALVDATDATALVDATDATALVDATAAGARKSLDACRCNSANSASTHVKQELRQED